MVAMSRPSSTGNCRVTGRPAPQQSGGGFVLGEGPWFPVPRQELIEPRDDVIVDPCEDVREVSFRVNIGQLRALDDRHGIGESFSAGVGAGKEKILSPESDAA